MRYLACPCWWGISRRHGRLRAEALNLESAGVDKCYHDTQVQMRSRDLGFKLALLHQNRSHSTITLSEETLVKYRGSMTSLELVEFHVQLELSRPLHSLFSLFQSIDYSNLHLSQFTSE